MDKQALVVTTAHRGVFFGYGVPGADETIRLEQVRMCVYWSAETKGVLGLAAKGPAKGSRVGPAVPVMHLRSVTSVMEASPAAVEAWEKAPWS